MKKLLLLLAFLIIQNLSFGQSYDEMLKAVNGTFKKDEVGIAVTFTKVIDVKGVSKEELFERVKPFFTYYYKSGESSIQVTDKEQSYILARGIYKEFTHEFHAMLNYSSSMNAEHVIRIDFKDDRLRVQITIEKIIEHQVGGSAYKKSYDTEKRNLCFMYPVIPMSDDKLSKKEKVDLKLFYKLYKTIDNTFENIEKYANKVSENDENW